MAESAEGSAARLVRTSCPVGDPSDSPGRGDSDQRPAVNGEKCMKRENGGTEEEVVLEPAPGVNAGKARRGSEKRSMSEGGGGRRRGKVRL